MSDDELINRLSAARPDVSTDLLEPKPQLIEEILMTTHSPKRRFVTPIRLGAAAALASAAAAIAITLPNSATTTAQPSTTTQVALTNMRRIAESTAAAFNSGRALIAMRSVTASPSYQHSSDAVFAVEFAGDNRSINGTITQDDEGRGSNSFPFANKVIDGRFFLEDGTRWVEDTNANLAGSDVFSIDPRTFLDGVADAAQFRETGTEGVDGVATRRLKATKLDRIPDFNLGIGPRGETDLTRFELWVDADNVVRKLVMSMRQTETSYRGAKAKLVKDADGTTRKVLDESTLTDPEQVTITTVYSARFKDLGAAITITAPPNAPKIAGQG